MFIWVYLYCVWHSSLPVESWSKRLFLSVVAARSGRSASSGGPRAARDQTAPSNTTRSTRTLTRTNSPVDWETLTCRKSENDKHASCFLWHLTQWWSQNELLSVPSVPPFFFVFWTLWIYGNRWVSVFWCVWVWFVRNFGNVCTVTAHHCCSNTKVTTNFIILLYNCINSCASSFEHSFPIWFCQGLILSI